MHDLIILGAGPAGLAASLYATKKRLDYLVISKDLGGKSNYSVRLPEADEQPELRADELVTVYKTRLQYLRHSYVLTTARTLRTTDGGFSVETEDGASEEARAVIVATGTRFQKLDVPGEMEFLSRALGYSSISYSHLFTGKRVFLAGNTDRAVSSALELSIHADAVTVGLLAGGSYDPNLVAYVRQLDRVEVIEDVTIKEFQGDDYARAVLVESSNGRRTITADGFFLEPEPSANAGFITDSSVLDERGYVAVDGSGMTAQPGLFAAGDVTGNGYEQILVSLGDGAKAALSAYRYLLQHGIKGR
jgi:alkyl hydroperoxide reductase subunit F